MAKLAAVTYGEALYELSVEEKKTDAFYEEVQTLRAVLKENPDFGALMNHPKLTKEEKEASVEAVFKGRVSDELTGFLVLLLKKDRYADLNAILEYFISRVKEEKGIGVAKVSSAIPLTDGQKEEVRKKLLETTSYKEMEIDYQVDDELIGGVVIRIGDRVVDSSIRSRLMQMKRELKDIEIA